MRIVKGSFNTGLENDSHPISTSETPYENNPPIPASTYDLTYHAKQLGKGLLVFGAGLLGYVGFNAFFGGRREENTPETRRMVDDNLDSSETSLLNLQAKISGISPSLDHQEPKGLVSTSFSTARTLLSLQQKEGAKDRAGSYGSTASVEANKETPGLASTRLAVSEISYQGGIEFRVNTYTTSFQGDASVTSLTEGGFVVVWHSNRQDGSGYGVYGRRYKDTGLPEGDEFQVNTYTLLDQKSPAVTAFPAGGFVVVWSGNRKDGGGCCEVYGQRYKATGLLEGDEFQVNPSKSSHQKFQAVTAFPTGGFVVVWQNGGRHGSQWDIYGQRYNTEAQPEGTEFRVNTYNASYSSDYQSPPEVIALTEGGFVVIWESYGQDGSAGGIYGQCYNTEAQPKGTEFQVNTYTTSFQYFPAVTAFLAGGFVVVWESGGQDGNSAGVYGQRYNNTCLPEGSEFQVNTYTLSIQGAPTVTAFPAGGFVVVWHSRGQDGSSYGIYGQRYTAAWMPEGTEFQVNTYVWSTQWFPVVKSFSAGGFVVVWQSNGQDGSSYGIYGRIFSADEYPVLLNNQLVIDEGGTVILTSAMLSAMDADSNNATLNFTVNNVQHGYFERNCTIGVAITSFIQQEVTDNAILFVHDGSESAPSYAVKVSDGSLETAYTVVNITFTNINDAPTLLSNQLIIEQGKKVILTSDMLSAMDADNDNATLNFMVNKVQQGYFECTSNTGVKIISFIQQAIINGNIRFVHNGSTIKPYYEIKVSDATLETAYVPANVIFSLSLRKNDSLPTPFPFLIAIGSVSGGIGLCISASAILLILPGIFLIKRKQNNRRRELILNEQDIELSDTFDLIEEEGSLGREELTVTTREQGFFQQPPIDNRVTLIDIPEGYRCPISYLIMCDPVVTADGHTYERECIEKWFLAHNTSPTTNRELPNRNLIPNFNLKKCISEFLSKNKKFEKSGDVYKPSNNQNTEKEESLGHKEPTITLRTPGLFQVVPSMDLQEPISYAETPEQIEIPTLNTGLLEQGSVI